MTVEEILESIGVSVDPQHAATLQQWNGKISAIESEAQRRLSAAQEALEQAQAQNQIIQSAIEQSGMTEKNLMELRANNAALAASNAAYKAALENVKSQGLDGITIADLPPVPAKAAPDPIQTLQETMMRGFSQVGQTFNEMNRYQRVFGAPLPVDPAQLGDLAARANLSVHDYMERTYHVGEKENEKRLAAEQKARDEYAAKKIEEYKAAHPIVAGNPELGYGSPSDHPYLPKPMDAKSISEFSALSPQQKIQVAKERVMKEIQSRMASA
ncbi:MAG: hypothetical protein ACP5EP_11440 [Acidobacteriaceae bacterium]